MGAAYRLWWDHYEEMHTAELVKFDSSEDGFTSDAPIGYNPKQQVWLMRHTKQSYAQYLRSVATAVFRNLTYPGLVLEKSNSGESCSAVCALRQSLCLEEALQYSEVNSCDRLREYFGCQRCDFSANIAAPSFLFKTQHCAVNPLYAKYQRPTCDSSFRGVSRMCPCIPLDRAFRAPMPFTVPFESEKKHMAEERKQVEDQDEEEEGSTAGGVPEHLATAAASVCDPTRTTWFGVKSEDQKCLAFLSDMSNIISLEPMGRTTWVGRTIKLVATYRLPPPSSDATGGKTTQLGNDGVIQQDSNTADETERDQDPLRVNAVADDDNVNSKKSKKKLGPLKTIKAIIKFPQIDFPHEAHAEAAAYVMDRTIGINRVPPVAFVFWPEDFLKKGFRNVTIPHDFQTSGSTLLAPLEESPDAVSGVTDVYPEDVATLANRTFSTAEKDVEWHNAEKQIFSFIKQFPNQGTIAGYSRVQNHHLNIGVSVQLLMHDIHRLPDTELRVSREIGAWFEEKVKPFKQEYPLYATSLNELSLMTLLDYAIGNEDRTPHKNCYVLGVCDRRCVLPSGMRHSTSLAPTFVLIDQGKSFYTATRKNEAFDEPEGNLFTEAMTLDGRGGGGSSDDGGDDTDDDTSGGKKKAAGGGKPKVAMCRMPQPVVLSLTRLKQDGSLRAVFKAALPPEVLVALRDGIEAAQARLERLSNHFSRCAAELKDPKLRAPWSDSDVEQ